jgi:hypothetical protein
MNCRFDSHPSSQPQANHKQLQQPATTTKTQHGWSKRDE